MKQYDYIFTGGGCAAMSLLVQMIAAGQTNGKRILIIDQARKNSNDRTWCFWESAPGFFDSIVCKEWEDVWFKNRKYARKLSLAPYRYKMIRGIDFYQHCLRLIHAASGIDHLYGRITNLEAGDGILQLELDGQPMQFAAGKVFNSIYDASRKPSSSSVHLLQHFTGWLIDTPQKQFDPAEATIMDFRTSQSPGTAFVYVLPLSRSRALVEYTLFSASTLQPEQYNDGLTRYLRDALQIFNYTVIEKEHGVIPMTNAQFPWFANGMYHIGTAGGQTKGSTGYTFSFIQRQTAAIVDQIKNNTLSTIVRPAASAARFSFYDSVLLRVLQDGRLEGEEIFSRMFRKNDPRTILRFLDNQSTLADDWKIIRSFPTVPFLRAACAQLFT